MVAPRPPGLKLALLPAQLLALLLAGGVLAGCSDTPPTARPEPSPSRSTQEKSPEPTGPTGTTEPTEPAERFDTWEVGASPLPLRADGFGQVLRTPRELRVRRLRTVDVLPPPTSDRFEGSVHPVTPAFVRRTRLAWSPGCPVPLDELRELRLSFVGFDGERHTGQMVVNASVADDVVEVFRTLHDARFPIEEMRLVTQADLDAPPTGDGNNTAAYACRPSVGTTSWSAHAYGLAVDLNPFNNPYTKGDLVLPELASAYTDRSWRRPGMIHPDGVVVRAFEQVGWTWGGTFRSVSDLHHFSADGR
ncbi:M15 family metallopeptidase [Nocardioides caldifontis]|uniref:M15 family metallopeptidase n=1 Tax=Nocardioides caldifontis TaxID=2588938 RepID=UPI001EF107C7|nr:M15 family metallopeptidase [Nocardioides caldifontis]